MSAITAESLRRNHLRILAERADVESRRFNAGLSEEQLVIIKGDMEIFLDNIQSLYDAHPGSLNIASCDNYKEVALLGFVYHIIIVPLKTFVRSFDSEGESEQLLEVLFTVAMEYSSSVIFKNVPERNALLVQQVELLLIRILRNNAFQPHGTDLLELESPARLDIVPTTKQ